MGARPSEQRRAGRRSGAPPASAATRPLPPDACLRGLEPPALLRRLGLHPRKGLSQSFLRDDGVCRAMADLAELEPADQVLEIGPGLGILTRVLLARAGRVVAVELDRSLAGHLPELAPGAGLEVVAGDALAIDPAEYFPGPYKLIANLPYQITSPVLSRFLLEVRRPTTMVVMVQREVAERVAAGPGAASYLSILTQAVADVRLVRRVKSGAFYPSPNVESAVLAIRPRPEPATSAESLPGLLRFVRAGFTQPRKTLANSLAQGLGLPRTTVVQRLAAAGLDGGRRPQELAVDEWVSLFAGGAFAE